MAILCLIYMLVLSLNAFAGPGHWVLSSTSASDSTALDSLLLEIGRAPEKVSYSGIQERITCHRGKTITLKWKIYHWAPDRSVIQFLEPQDLQNSILVVQGEKVKFRGDKHLAKIFSYHGTRHLLQNGRIFKEIKLLKKNYSIVLSGGEEYLNRAAIKLSVQPKISYRPSLLAFIDENSHLLLKTRRLPASGPDSLAEVSQFVKIEIGEPDSSIFHTSWGKTEYLKRKERKIQKFNDLNSLLNTYKKPILIPNHLPAGFSLLRIQSIKRCEKSYLHFLYGDGLTYVSLFQHEKKSMHSNRTKKRDNKGTTGLFSIVRGKMGKISYIIAGEIPRAELEKMSRSLTLIEKRKRILGKFWWIFLITILSLVLIFNLYHLIKQRREKVHG